MTPMLWEVFILAPKTLCGLSILSLFSTQWRFHRNSSLSMTFRTKLGSLIDGPRGGPPQGTTTLVENGRTMADRGSKVSFFNFLPFFDHIFSTEDVSSLFIAWAFLDWLSSTLMPLHGVENHWSWSNLMGFVSSLLKNLVIIAFSFDLSPFVVFLKQGSPQVG